MQNSIKGASDPIQAVNAQQDYNILNQGRHGSLKGHQENKTEGSTFKDCEGFLGPISHPNTGSTLEKLQLSRWAMPPCYK